MLKYLVFIFIVISFSYSSLSQSEITIQGNISNVTGNPLELVNISIKNTSNGAVSNTKGNYTLNYSGKSPVQLNFSHLSYIRKDTSIIFASGKNIVLNVTLKPKDEQIEEIKIIDEEQKNMV